MSNTELPAKRPPLPKNREYVGTIREVKTRVWRGKADPSQSGVAADVSVEIDLSEDPEAAKAVGARKVTLTDSIMLDLTDSGSLDPSPSKNGKLRRYRAAVGLSVSGEALGIDDLPGRAIRVTIKHYYYDGDFYDGIDSVAEV